MRTTNRARAARKGTVCAHCWTYWRQESGHDASRCRDVWDDPDSPNGLTVCMCGCRKEVDQ
jgi:hypothetical protein